MKQIYLIITSCFCLVGCGQFLDVKSDKSLAIPESFKDIRAMLDYQYRINDNLPGLADIASDDYFVDYNTWKSRSVRDQGLYVWDGGPDTYHNTSWSGPYMTIMVANVALEAIERIGFDKENAETGQLKGEALFIRAFNHFLLAQLFCPPFEPEGTNSDNGIPIRKSSDLNVESVRLSIADSYRNIIQDLEEALGLLPPQSASITRPDVCSAYALLSRIYVSMQNYQQALYYAEKALSLKSILLDYNNVSAEASAPFLINENPELIYFAQNVSAGTFVTTARANVDTVLYASYEDKDRRKLLFFQDKANGFKAFKGQYTGAVNSLFNGLATDELYLTAAECHARMDKYDQSLKLLNSFLTKRYEAGAFEQIQGLTGSGLLDKILLERRKQLLFRGIRWMDLRRLNFEDRYQKILYRNLDNGSFIETYRLPPHDLRYTHLIPPTVIELTGMPQNPR